MHLKHTLSHRNPKRRVKGLLYWHTDKEKCRTKSWLFFMITIVSFVVFFSLHFFAQKNYISSTTLLQLGCTMKNFTGSEKNGIFLEKQTHLFSN